MNSPEEQDGQAPRPSVIGQEAQQQTTPDTMCKTSGIPGGSPESPIPPYNIQHTDTYNTGPPKLPPNRFDGCHLKNTMVGNHNSMHIGGREQSSQAFDKNEVVMDALTRFADTMSKNEQRMKAMALELQRTKADTAYQISALSNQVRELKSANSKYEATVEELRVTKLEDQRTKTDMTNQISALSNQVRELKSAHNKYEATVEELRVTKESNKEMGYVLGEFVQATAARKSSSMFSSKRKDARRRLCAAIARTHTLLAPNGIQTGKGK